jgi:hypothetical protein
VKIRGWKMQQRVKINKYIRNSPYFEGKNLDLDNVFLKVIRTRQDSQKL